MAKLDLRLQKRLAAEVAGVGLDKVILDPSRSKDIKEAITKADIRALISEGAIKIKQARSPSRHRARKRHEQRKKGRQRGAGKRKGTAKARSPRKRTWINLIRAQRNLLKYLREKNKIDAKAFRLLYKKAKGGEFRSKAHMMFFIKRNNLLKEEAKK